MRAGWIVGVALMSACAKPHVVLPTVPPDLGPEQRVQMFYQLYATGERTTTTTTCGRGGGCSTNVEKTLYLANGTQVHYPEDLLPVVAPESVTARAVRDVHAERRKARSYMLVGLASVVGFATVGVLSFGDDEIGFSTSQKLGLLITVGGVLVGTFGAWYHTREATEHWGVANESYNAGLAQRLAVCTSGLAVVPCESAPSPSPGPAPWPAALPPPAPPVGPAVR